MEEKQFGYKELLLSPAMLGSNTTMGRSEDTITKVLQVGM